jgi:hypothetical protein
MCLPKTREKILHEIMAWARSEPVAAPGAAGPPEARPRIYWLNGMAGTGKSTIARTIARCCADESILGASFFFSRGGGELETARMLVSSIAVQLAEHSPALRKHICRAVAEQPNIGSRMLGDQWRHLVLRPFEMLGAAAADDWQQPAAFIVIIDALDECRDEREIEFVLQLLSETPELAVERLKIFLTSRPEIPIRNGIQEIPPCQRRHLVLHHIDPVIVDGDIQLFFEHELRKVDWGCQLQTQLPTVTFGSRLLHELVLRAGGLFIWAATVCRFVLDGRQWAQRRLSIILAGGASAAETTPERKLDEIYTNVLNNALSHTFGDEETNELTRMLRMVLSAISTLHSSLSALSLEALLDLPQNAVRATLLDLHSIFDVPDDVDRAIRPHHASVRDYLLNGRRCTDSRFLVDQQAAHTLLARQCIWLLTRELHQDICSLRMPDAKASDVDPAQMAACIPPHVRYACRYWVDHVRRSHHSPEQMDAIHDFLRTKLLHWIESLSLLGLVAEGIDMLCHLESITVSVSANIVALWKCLVIDKLHKARYATVAAGFGCGRQAVLAAQPARNPTDAASALYIRYCVCAREKPRTADLLRSSAVLA